MTQGGTKNEGWLIALGYQSVLGTFVSRQVAGVGLGSGRLWARCLSVLLSALVWLQVEAASSRSEPKSREALEALYVYNIAKYATLPNLAMDAGFKIGYIGSDEEEMSAFDKSLQGKRVKGRPIEVVFHKKYDPELSLTGYQLVFVSEDEQDALPRIVEAIGMEPVLTVTDRVNPSVWQRAGGICNLTEVRRKLTFDVSLTAANRVGIRFDARFLRVARKVHTESTRKRKRGRE